MQPRPATTGRALEELALLSEEEFREQFKGSSVMRASGEGRCAMLRLPWPFRRTQLRKQHTYVLLKHPEPFVREQAARSLVILRVRSERSQI